METEQADAEDRNTHISSHIQESHRLAPGKGNMSDECLIFPKLPREICTKIYITPWMEAAGISKPITFHCSRHTFGTMMLTLGVDLYTVSKLLGHTKVETTQIYAKIINKKRMMQSVL